LEAETRRLRGGWRACGGLGCVSGQPVPTAQNAFDPPEKQFDLPPLLIQQRDLSRRQFDRTQVGHQPQHFFGRLHPDHSEADAVVARLAAHKPRIVRTTGLSSPKRNKPR